MMLEDGRMNRYMHLMLANMGDEISNRQKNLNIEEVHLGCTYEEFDEVLHEVRKIVNKKIREGKESL